MSVSTYRDAVFGQRFEERSRRTERTEDDPVELWIPAVEGHENCASPADIDTRYLRQRKD